MPQPTIKKYHWMPAFALSMALALVLYLPLAYGYFSFRMKAIKSEMKLEASRTWKKEQLVHLVFSVQEESEIERPEDREILWQGKMYDVVTEHRDEQNQLHVYALLDEDEMALKKWVRKFLTNDASESPTKRSKSDVLKVFAKAMPASKTLAVPLSEVDHCFVCAYMDVSYGEIDHPVHVGPPRMV